MGTLKNLYGNWATITYFKKGDCSKLREAPTLSNSSELSRVPVCDILGKYKNVTLLANDGVSVYAISEVQSIEQQSEAMDITEPWFYQASCKGTEFQSRWKMQLVLVWRC